MDSLQHLLSMPVEKVVQDLIAVREERVRLENHETLLERTLELIVEQDPRAAAFLEAPGSPSTPFGPLRMQIRRLLASYAFRDTAPWLPRDVLAALTASGSRGVTIDNVRVTMRRMAQDGELLEGEGMQFKLPSAFVREQDQLKMPVGEQAPLADAPAALPADNGAIGQRQT
jgi:hypothetical protein